MALHGVMGRLTASLCVAFFAAPAAAGSWEPVSEHLSGVLDGIAALPNGDAIVAGGLNGVGVGLFALKGKNLTQTLNIMQTKCKLCQMGAIAVAPDGLRGVAGGVAMLGEPATHSTDDGGQTWVPSKLIASGFRGAVSGKDIQVVKGTASGLLASSPAPQFAYVSEVNSFPNGTLCNHNPVSAQCSGVLLSSDGGATYEYTDWQGTDGPDTDAIGGAFPSPTTWYIAGGLIEGEEDPPGPAWKATVMKTADAGKTFKTVFNITAPQSDPGKGVGGMSDIDCATVDVCYAVSSCCDDNCGAGGYGAYVHTTTDGGVTWKTSPLFYEHTMTKVVVIGPKEAFVGGGGVGVFDHGVIWHTADGGDSWTNTTLPAAGGIFSMSVLPDGSLGYAVSVNGVTSTSAIWKYTN